MKKFYVTTPIYYINDVPHLGHAYTTIMADVIKRYKQLTGHEVFFLTGTDEHGQKIEESARKQNLTPKELADKVVVRFQDLWKTLNLDYNRFIRTTDPYHAEAVKKIFKKVMDKGDIYPGDYAGHYCVSCESYISDTARDAEDNINKICPDCEKTTRIVTEKCYFFRLSAYQDKLLKFYEQNPDFIVPRSRMNEVASFVRMGLKDLSVTRSTVKWGIPVPNDEHQTIYVWFDALTNYLSAINYASENEEFKKFWPADLHIMAKDILKFHAVYWPAFLMAADLPLPRQELIHGWWLKDEKKMSKSIGNVLDPNILLRHFSPDAIKYFLMREAPIGADGNFSHQGFINRVNTDLSNDWGNLVSRTGGMIEKYFNNRLSADAEYTDKEDTIRDAYLKLESDVFAHFDEYKFNRGLERIFEYIYEVNKYIVDAEPWLLAKSENQRPRLAAVLKTVVRAILGVNNLLSPILPETAEKIRTIFNRPAAQTGWPNTGEDFAINKVQALFPRVDAEKFFADEESSRPKPAPTAHPPAPEQPTTPTAEPTNPTGQPTPPTAEPTNPTGQPAAPTGQPTPPTAAAPKPQPTPPPEQEIEYEDFQKVRMVIALVLHAEPHPNADRLLKLTVNTGTDERTLVAGVAQYYKPEDLIGRKIIIVKNLKPAKLRGVTSQGMILAASDPANGQPFIPIIPDNTPVGAILK